MQTHNKHFDDSRNKLKINKLQITNVYVLAKNQRMDQIG
jgi:hypothetical protein